MDRFDPPHLRDHLHRCVYVKHIHAVHFANIAEKLRRTPIIQAITYEKTGLIPFRG